MANILKIIEKGFSEQELTDYIKENGSEKLSQQLTYIKWQIEKIQQQLNNK